MLKALGFKSFKVKCFQVVGFEYPPAPLQRGTEEDLLIIATRVLAVRAEGTRTGLFFQGCDRALLLLSAAIVCFAPNVVRLSRCHAMSRFASGFAK